MIRSSIFPLYVYLYTNATYSLFNYNLTTSRITWACFHNEINRVVRKPAFCICENKDADQLRGNRLCFRYTDSTISLLPKYEISSLQPSSVAVQPGLYGIWSETPKTGFLTTRLKCVVCIAIILLCNSQRFLKAVKLIIFR